MVIPQAMRQVGMAGAGGPEVLHVEEGPVPQPRAGEVLVRVLAAGVNRPDVAQRKGAYPPPPGASPLLGLEVAGEVARVGDGVAAWRVGDRVCALANGGGYAEWCAVPAGQCLPWPAGYDAVRAAALPETFFTVWANLFELGGLRAGETALVHGGTSGIGTTAIQLAHERGARVYATAGSPEKVAACLRLGADGAVNYREADFAESVRQWTDGRGVDVVLDMVGAPYFARNLRCLAMDGRLVLIAFQGGSKLDAGADLLPIMVRRLRVTGSTMRPRTAAQKAEIADALRREVWPALDAGRCGPVIQAVFPLERAADAHRTMEEGAHVGKIVLRVADGA
jgi:NADPH2:quinone reductase